MSPAPDDWVRLATQQPDVAQAGLRAAQAKLDEYEEQIAVYVKFERCVVKTLRGLQDVAGATEAFTRMLRDEFRLSELFLLLGYLQAHAAQAQSRIALLEQAISEKATLTVEPRP